MPRRSLAHDLDVVSSAITTLLRGGVGIATRPAAARPNYLFELYEFESCPYCRLVREALTELDLDALIYPCPKGGERFRPKVEVLGGKTQFPFLVDPNTARSMYESADIVRYLFENYGGGELPLHWRFMDAQKFSSTVAGLVRAGRGQRARASVAPEKPLELYAFESSPYARLVRERLCELEIPYVLRACGRTTASDWVPPGLRRAFGVEAAPETLNRRALLARAGVLSIPYLIDPNTDTALAESAAILAYLEATYATEAQARAAAS
jgi:glutathione S-transferase